MAEQTEAVVTDVGQRTEGRPLRLMTSDDYLHDADATRARVRNVTYQGNWPRALPGSLNPPR
jgi:hypothetical protein